MDKTKIENTKNAAFQLCAEIREQYQGKLWTYGGMHCMESTTTSKVDHTKLCVNNALMDR
jgi:hypothetical protein